MKRYTLGAIAVCMALLLLMSVDVYAGSRDRAGTATATELLIPVGARDLALGGANIAMTSGIEAIYWNPAGLSRSRYSATAMFSHMEYIADIGVEYAAVAGNFGGIGHIGLSLKALSLGDIIVTTEDAPDGTGEEITPTFITLGLTYSKLLTDRISVGATANLVTEDINRAKATGFAFNVGVQYSDLGGIDGLCLGVAIKNLGPEMTWDGPALLRRAEADDVLRPGTYYQVEAASFELPSTIELGAGYSRPIGESSKLNFVSLFQNNNFATDEVKFGVEYEYNDFVFLRGGYDFSPDEENDEFIYGATLGGGLHFSAGATELFFDYAFRDVDFLDSNHVFSLRVGF